MGFSAVIRTVFEVFLVGFTVWGLFNEDKFVKFENRLFSLVKRHRLHIVKCDSVYCWKG